MSLREGFQEVWQELLAATSDDTMRDWPELEEFCFHVYRCGSADGTAQERTRIASAAKVLRRKYVRHVWGKTALDVANEMLAVINLGSLRIFTTEEENDNGTNT